LLIFVVPIFITLVLSKSDPAARMRGLRVAVASLIIEIASILWCFHYYGTPVPLSFYAKSTHLYGPNIYAIYRPINGIELRAYVLGYGLLIVAAVAGIIHRTRHGLSQDVILDIVLLASCVAFLLYYRFGVLQIMYYGERFYYPTLPGFIYLAGRSVPLLRQVLSGGLRADRPLRSPYMVAILCVITVLFTAGIVRAIARPSKGSNWFRDGSVKSVYFSRAWTAWLGLDYIAGLPDNVKIASTDVGLPSAMNERLTIVDMSGLNNRTIATHAFEPRLLYVDGLPDVIYMPAPNYTEMTAAIRNDATFRQRYIDLDCGMANCSLDVAVRRDSPYRDGIVSQVRARKASLDISIKRLMYDAPPP
jgi:hypothetical protein